MSINIKVKMLWTIAITLSLVVPVSVIGVIRLGTDDTGQGWFGDDVGLIVCSNGKSYEATNANLQIAVDLGENITVTVPKTEIDITNDIAITKSNVTLISNGAILKASGALTYSIISIRSCSDVTIKGFVLDGNKYAGGDSGGITIFGIGGSDPERLLITRNTIMNTNTSGIFCYEMNNSEISFNKLYGIGNVSNTVSGSSGIQLNDENTGCFNNTIMFNDLRHIQNHGIKIYAPGLVKTYENCSMNLNNKVLYNYVEDTKLGEPAYPALNGVGIELMASYCTVIGNTVIMNAYMDGGIMIDSSHNIISQNTIIKESTSGSDSAIVVVSPSWGRNLTDNNTISDNTIRNCGSAGITLSGTRDNRITGNKIYGSYYSMYIVAQYNDTVHNIISGNSFSGGRITVYQVDASLYGINNNSFTGNDVSLLTYSTKIEYLGDTKSGFLFNNTFRDNNGYLAFMIPTTNVSTCNVPGRMWYDVSTHKLYICETIAGEWTESTFT